MPQIETTNVDTDEKCANIKCSPIDYYAKESKCPEDSVEVAATSIEEECCSIKTKCQCQCEFKLKPDCGRLGNFEAALVRHGNNTPNFCCDLYICSNISKYKTILCSYLNLLINSRHRKHSQLPL